MRYRLRTLLIVLALGPIALWVLALFWVSYEWWTISGDPAGLQPLYQAAIAICVLALFTVGVFIRKRVLSRIPNNGNH